MDEIEMGKPLRVFMMHLYTLQEVLDLLEVEAVNKATRREATRTRILPRVRAALENPPIAQTRTQNIYLTTLTLYTKYKRVRPLATALNQPYEKIRRLIYSALEWAERSYPFRPS